MDSLGIDREEEKKKLTSVICLFLFFGFICQCEKINETRFVFILFFSLPLFLRVLLVSFGNGMNIRNMRITF